MWVHRTLPFGRLLFCGAVLAFVGCGGPSDAIERHPVRGTVTFQGQPLSEGTISFTPQGESDSPQISGGAVISNGQYEIPAEDGLPVGTYLVRISAAGDTETPEMPGDSSEVVAEELIPPQYNVDSEETVEVKAGGPNQFDYTIE